MIRPWQVLIVGIVLGMVGGVIALMALGGDVPELLWATWAFSAVGGPTVFVGLIGIGVELGVRSAETQTDGDRVAAILTVIPPPGGRVGVTGHADKT